MMLKHPNNVNLDNLFDLKRAEKPSDEFWDGFQKEFRQRQLQTLIEKESKWKNTARLFFARSSLLVPLSGLAVAVFVLTLGFQQDEPLNQLHYEAVELLQAEPQSTSLEVVSDSLSESVAMVDDVPVAPVDAFLASASFVMDSIPNEEPEPLNYTREFPTSTISPEKRSMGALVSYTIARENPSIGFSARPQTIGF